MTTQVDKYEGKSLRDIELRIETLSVRMNLFAKDGDYLGADNDNNEIKRLQEVIAKRKEAEVGLKQKAETDEIKKAFDLLKSQFNTLWDDEMNKFDLDASKQVVAMKNRQENETNDLSSRLENERENYPKFSTEIIALRKNEKLLVIQKKFKEALKVKEKADLLQIAEVQKFEKSEDARIKSVLNQLQKKQEEEKHVLGRRLDRERKELQIQRDTDLKKIEQRFLNLQKEQESKNKIQSNQDKKAAVFEQQAKSNTRININYHDHQPVKFPQALAPQLAKTPIVNAGRGTTLKSKKFGAAAMNKSSKSPTLGGRAGAGTGAQTKGGAQAGGGPEGVAKKEIAAPTATDGAAEADGDTDVEEGREEKEMVNFYGNGEKRKVTFTIVKGNVLKKQDVRGKGDPYVVVKIGQIEKRTHTVKDTQQPVWNEDLVFDGVSDTDLASVSLSLLDEDVVTKDDLVGTSSLNVLHYGLNTKAHVSVVVKDKEGHDKGSVEVDVLLI